MFYVFHGDDSHSQKETLSGLTAKLGDAGMLDLNTTKFDRPMALADLKNACNAIPFLAKVRLVITHDLLSNADKPFLKELAAYLPQLPETTRLFFLESQPLKGTNVVLKLAQEHDQGYVKLFQRPEGAALERWIKQQVSAQNGRISPHAANLMAVNIGSNLEIMQNEIDKLVLFKSAPEPTQIEAEDVLLLSPYAAEASIFELVDALGSRNGKKASLLFQEKIAEGADPFYLFSMFVRQFRLLLQVKELADAGLRPPAIAKEAGLHTFVAGKLYQQAQGFSLQQLEDIYRHLLDIDVAVKTGRNDMATALNLLVAGLTLDTY